ncbi:unnamed protein product [Malus baccata var. baccata]
MQATNAFVVYDSDEVDDSNSSLSFSKSDYYDEDDEGDIPHTNKNLSPIAGKAIVSLCFWMIQTLPIIKIMIKIKTLLIFHSLRRDLRSTLIAICECRVCKSKLTDSLITPIYCSKVLSFLPPGPTMLHPLD